MSPERLRASFRPARRRRTDHRAGSRWWNAARYVSNGSSECRTGPSRGRVFRKQRVRDDGVNRGRTGSGQRLGAGDHGAAGGNDIVDDQGRTTGNAGRVRESDFDRAVAAAGFLRNGMGQPEPAGEVADPRPRLRIRPDHDGRRIKTGLAQRRLRLPAWPTDCRTRSREILLRCRVCDADARRR